MTGTPREDTLFEFPCDFPIKIMGQANDEFRSLALGIVTRHFGTLAPENIEERTSANGRYLSFTCTVRAESKAQLDALYRELTSCRQVLVAL
jgi:putative lipoic acid-binding regulatory protein